MSSSTSPIPAPDRDRDCPTCHGKTIHTPEQRAACAGADFLAKKHASSEGRKNVSDDQQPPELPADDLRLK